jgi:hypothetical protein
MLGKCPLHRWTEELRHVAHNRMHAPVLNEGPELIHKIFDLLSGEPRYGGSAAKTLSQRLVADLAFFDIGLKVSRRGWEREFECCKLDALVSAKRSVAILRRCPSEARKSQSENKA